MSVASITGSTAVYTPPVSNRSNPTPPPPPSDDGVAAAGEARISRRGKFLGRLQELSKSDPAQAKQFATDLVAKIRSEANGATDSRRLQFADKLEQAAQSGDYSSLFTRGGDAAQSGRGAGAYAAATRSSW